MSGSARLAGKVALVTGGSRGLGLEIARTFIAQGAEVYITARDERGVAEAASALGPRCHGLAADVGDAQQVQRVADAIATRFGRLDILINNAAVGSPHPIDEMSDQALDTHIRCNLYGPIHCIRAAVPLMKAAGGGEIVSISSESVNFPFPLLSVYAATKAAVETLSRGLRAELALHNIRVSVLRSGFIADTSFGAGWTAEQQQTVFSVWEKTGHLSMVGHQKGGVQPAVIANALVDMVTLGASGSMDLLELRAR